MTQTLKKQLSIGCGALVLGGALVWGSGSLRAQDNNGSAGTDVGFARRRLSRDQAARNFVLLLQNNKIGVFYLSALDRMEASSISTKSERELGPGIQPLLLEMSAQWKQPPTQITVQEESGNTAIVTVKNAPAPAPLPLVLVQENGSWGVDLLETYARWNGLDSAAKAQYVAALTNEFDRARENARRASCQSNLKQIALGIAQYNQDYDEKLPLAKPWIDVLQPYVKSEQIFKCPAVTDPKGYGYAYNSRLSAKGFEAIESVSQTVSVYETSVLKRNAFGMGENPAFRHYGGANYAFVDGHVKWFDKTKIPSFNLKS